MNKKRKKEVKEWWIEQHSQRKYFSLENFVYIVEKYDNLKKENKRLNNIINQLETQLNDLRQVAFIKYNSNEWNNCLSFNDDIKPILDKLKELQNK